MSKLLALLLLLVAATAEHTEKIIELSASGTTNPSKLHWHYMSLMEDRCGEMMSLTYRAVGSGTGVQEFVAGANDFGATEIPLTAAQATTYGKPHLHIPHAIGTVSIFHSIPHANILNGAVNLTAPILAKIFQRTITTWDHPDIINDNPALKVPAGQPITVWHRKLGSSSTMLLSQYMTAAAPGIWTLGTGGVLNWPEDTKVADGSADMSDAVKKNPFSIGYMESFHGIAQGLTEVALKNKNGKWLTSPEADVGAAATYATIPASTENWEKVSMDMVNQAGDKTWPLTSFSWMIVAQDLSPMAELGAVIKAYMEYTMSDDGQALVERYGFVKIPDNVKAINNAGIASMKLAPGVTAISFEYSTAPVTGNGNQVCSAKRQSYSGFQLDQLNLDVGDLKADLTATKKTMAKEFLEMHASGTTNPSKLHWKWMEDLEERLGMPIAMSYRAVGSGTGQAEFLGRVNDWGCSEIPLSKAQQDSYGEELLHIPFVIGTVSIFHNVPVGAVNGLKLNLTADLLAKIFQRDIKTWDHSDITKLNPNLQVPQGQNIVVVHRTLGSSSTFLTSQYFSIAAPGTWKLGVGGTLTWPADTINAFGSAGVSSKIAETPWSIGYIETDHGVKDGLREVELQNKNGIFLNGQTSDVGAAADSAVLPAADGNWENVNLVDQTGVSTWPMTTFSYMLVPRDLTDYGETGAIIKAYLEYSLSQEAQASVKEFGFRPVPQKVIDIAMAGIASLKLAPGVTPFTFEGATTLTITGASPRVFSAKRRKYTEVKLEEQASQIKALMDANQALQAQVDALVKKVAGITGGKVYSGSCKGACGKKTKTTGGNCYCDAKCPKQGDCCSDMSAHCTAAGTDKGNVDCNVGDCR